MLIYLQMIETEEERSKFEEIYLEYRNLLFWLADRRLHSAEDAEDAVHNVFVKVAENIRRIEPVSHRTKQLLVVILENTVTDMLRKRGREPVEAGWEAEPSAVDPDLGEKELLEACILALPQQQRTILWLKYHFGYSLREIAGLMGMTLVSAQKADQRAKKRLEELYREGGGEG